MKNILSALEQLGPLLDQLKAGVQFIDDDFHYRYVNQTAARHGQRERGELLGRTMEECYPGIERTEVFTHIRETLATGQRHAMENAFTFPNGTERWFEVELYAVAGGVVVISSDITRRKQLEVHLKHAQRMAAAAQLAGGIAHDFNNALLIIRSFSELLSLNEPLSEGGALDLKEVLAATDRASELTQKLLSFARHTSRAPERFDLAGHFESIAATLTATLGEGIRLTTDIPPGLGVVKLNPRSWEQTIVSLALNARDAMNGRGRVTIGGHRTMVEEDVHLDGGGRSLKPGNYVCFFVQDEGPGIAKDLIDKIFDPFFSTKRTGGSGLGLSTCWGIIEQAGGTIEVHSQEGEGARFEVFLPRKLSLSSDSILPPKSYPRLQTQGGYRILLVDDEPAILRALTGLLEKSGHVVIQAPNGQEALKRLQDGGIQLMISDVLMPGMSGIELAEVVETEYKDTPVLLMSGYSPADESLRSARRFPLLIKPFRTEYLLRAINDLLVAERGPGDAG